MFCDILRTRVTTSLFCKFFFSHLKIIIIRAFAGQCNSDVIFKFEISDEDAGINIRLLFAGSHRNRINTSQECVVFSAVRKPDFEDGEVLVRGVALCNPRK